MNDLKSYTSIENNYSENWDALAEENKKSIFYKQINHKKIVAKKINVILGLIQ